MGRDGIRSLLTPDPPGLSPPKAGDTSGDVTGPGAGSAESKAESAALAVADPNVQFGTTIGVGDHGALSDQRLVEEVGTMAAGRAATAGAPPPRASARDVAPFVTRLLPEPPEGPSASLDGLTTSVGIPDVSAGAGYRVRTGDIQLGKLTLYQLS